jgi:hypothetical protein
MWALAFVVIVDWITTCEMDWVGTAMLIVAVMVTLSWGYATPALIGGSIAVWLIVRIWRVVRIAPSGARALAPVVALGVIAVAFAALHAGRTYPYYDRAAPQLTASLSSLAPDFAGIRTNATTARYMSDISACVRRYPAGNVAVLPDNPVIYQVFDLNDPFPLDWMWPPEYASSPGRIIDAARALRAHGDYLVLYQPVYGFDLAKFSVSQLQGHRGVLVRADPLLRKIDAQLRSGRSVTCGVFSGRYTKGSPKP